MIGHGVGKTTLTLMAMLGMAGLGGAMPRFSPNSASRKYEKSPDPLLNQRMRSAASAAADKIIAAAKKKRARKKNWRAIDVYGIAP